MQFGHYILQFGQIHLAIWTNTFLNLDKYIFKFRQIYFAISTSIFVLGQRQIHCQIQSHSRILNLLLYSCWYKAPICSLDLNILQSGQIHLENLTNLFSNLDKFIFEFKQTYFPILKNPIKIQIYFRALVSSIYYSIPGGWRPQYAGTQLSHIPQIMHPCIGSQLFWTDVR